MSVSLENVSKLSVKLKKHFFNLESSERGRPMANYYRFGFDFFFFFFKLNSEFLTFCFFASSCDFLGNFKNVSRLFVWFCSFALDSNLMPTKYTKNRIRVLRHGNNQLNN